MDIRQLTYFCDSVSLGSFSEAAASHNVTVQAISKSVADLEREVGRTLLVRDKFGVYPNADGIVFASLADDVMERFHALRDLTSHRGTWRHDDDTVRMVICSPRIKTYVNFCEVLTRIVSKATGLKVAMDVDTCPNAVRRLRSGECDILVTLGASSRSDLESRQFGVARACVLVAPNNPLVKLDRLTVEDLNAYPVGRYEPMDGICDGIVGTYVRKRGLASPMLEVTSDEVAFSACFDKNAYFLTLRPPADNGFDNLVTKQLVEQDRIPVPLCLVGLRKRRCPAFNTLLEVLTEGSQMLLKLASE